MTVGLFQILSCFRISLKYFNPKKYRLVTFSFQILFSRIKSWSSIFLSLLSFRHFLLSSNSCVRGCQQDRGEPEGSPEERLCPQQIASLWTHPGQLDNESIFELRKPNMFNWLGRRTMMWESVRDDLEGKASLKATWHYSVDLSNYA